MKVTYYLNEGRKKNLYCRISDGAERVSFSLGYTLNQKEWNEKEEELPFEDPYYFALMSFKRYLNNRYHELKSLEAPNILATLKHQAESFIDGSGIEGIAQKMFDDNNEADQVPTYNQFIEAFEKHTKLKKGDYKAQTVGNVIHFYPNDGEALEIDSYEGLTARLRSFIDRRSHDELYTETNESIWSEIYLDAGIEKHIFLPVMLSEWENYWSNKYIEIKKAIGRTEHLDEMKNQSWRHFQVFMECYDGAADIIGLAININDSHLYPLAVITMLTIFNADVCYDEYCESEFFGSGDWESISLDDKEDEEPHRENGEVNETPVLFIRPLEL